MIDAGHRRLPIATITVAPPSDRDTPDLSGQLVRRAPAFGAHLPLLGRSTNEQYYPKAGIGSQPGKDKNLSITQSVAHRNGCGKRSP